MPPSASHSITPLPRWKRDLPNTLTASRVVLAVLFFAVLTPWHYHAPIRSIGEEPFIIADPWLILAAALFAVAALTDAIDGPLARRWGAVSTFGRVMDPFADKMLVIGAFVFLASPAFTLERPNPPSRTLQASGVEPWMVALILGRELLVTSVRAVLEADGVRFPATLSGKLKMVFQSVAVPVILGVLALWPLFHLPPAAVEAADPRRTWAGWAVLVTAWSTVLVTTWSGLPYAARALRAIRSEHRAKRIERRAERGGDG